MQSRPAAGTVRYPATVSHLTHLAALDGWRGVSILLVLASHLLPLGPKAWSLNVASGTLGMVFFFNLSGFLITATLLRQPKVGPFLLRRFCRILPLLWLVLLVVLPLVHAPGRMYLPSFLCYSNLPPFYLLNATGHLWSIGVEMQFYLLIAGVFAVLGRRGLYLLPFSAAAITVGRIWTHDPGSIVTIRRADEILAGAMLLMVWEGLLGKRLPALLKRVPTAVWFALTAASCMQQMGALEYLRPYLAMCLLGSVLFQPDGRTARAMQAKWLVYIASISYAVYVIHGALFHLPWFVPDDKVAMYARRPVGLLLVWGLAHVSTRYYEAWWIRMGKRWAEGWLRRLDKHRGLADERTGVVGESARMVA